MHGIIAIIGSIDFMLVLKLKVNDHNISISYRPTKQNYENNNYIKYIVDNVD